jgi:predicted nucleic acid-binding protein
LFESSRLSILRPDENDELAALELFQKYADQRVSYTDCVSFVLMERQNIKCAFSFDRHFTIPGFDVEP